MYRYTQASSVTFHMEAVGDAAAAAALAARIKSLGMRAGVALKPGTPVESVFPLVDASPPAVDMVLCLSVEPGFGGQSFMARVRCALCKFCVCVCACVRACVFIIH